MILAVEPPVAAAAAMARVELVVREHHAQLYAALYRCFRDFALVEDGLGDAITAAIAAWPSGAPERPAAWLYRAAHNAILSQLRHRAMAERKLSERGVGEPTEPALEVGELPDDRLRLMFTCCHPALALEARSALALQVLCGLPTQVIARLFLAAEPAIAQRLVRAKRKIRAAGIPFALPSEALFEERLDGVALTIYLLFTEGYRATAEVPMRPALCDEAIALARQLTQLLPWHAETAGLYALMLFHDSRRAARIVGDELVPLDQQDRSKWDLAAIRQAEGLLEGALARGRAGPYQIQAAIAALHATAPSAAATDWPQIASLYEELLRWVRSPAVWVARAVALGMARGPEVGLAALEALPPEHAGEASSAPARADLLRRAGRFAEAREAYAQAIAWARDPWEARTLRRRLAECEPSPHRRGS